jgi:hypothetical protein
MMAFTQCYCLLANNTPEEDSFPTADSSPTSMANCWSQTGPITQVLDALVHCPGLGHSFPQLLGILVARVFRIFPQLKKATLYNVTPPTQRNFSPSNVLFPLSFSYCFWGISAVKLLYTNLSLNLF